MGQPSYVCVSCGEHFTRNTSARRHNFTLHNNTGYVVSWTEYLAGRSTNRYQASSPHLPRRRPHNFQHTATIAGPIAAVADSMGDIRPTGIPLHGQYRQQSQVPPQAPPSASPPPQTTTMATMMPQYMALREQLLQQPQQQQHSQPISQLQSTTPPQAPTPQPQPPGLQSQPRSQPTFTLSSETLIKLAELRGLLYRHSSTFPDFETIIQGAKTFALSGDLTFLEEKLAYFRSLDAMSGQRAVTGQSNVVI